MSRHRLAWLQALQDPAVVRGWSLDEWQDQLRLARRLRLLARLAAAVLDEPSVGAALPREVHDTLVGERRLSTARTTAMRWGLGWVSRALAGADYPRVLLKGAAYVMQGLPNAQGRMPSDIDILVPRHAIADAQARLLAQGWEEIAVDPHDHRYYHEWSHEVPPMRHGLHLMELDLHHNILPPVARDRVDAALLLGELRPLAQPPEAADGPWWTLSPEDQVLHCAVHLFNDSELRDRLRDLVDLDTLLRSHGVQPGFDERLIRRAQTLRLTDALVLGTSLCAEWLGTPCTASMKAWCQPRLRQPRLAVLRRLFAAVLYPTAADDEPGWPAEAAARALLLRHHWRRLPLPLLLRHVVHKWTKNTGPDPKGKGSATDPA
jgi:hypothetical protein